MKRTILITGATGKLGKVFVRNFLKKNDDVIAVSKTKKNLDLLQKEFSSYGNSLSTFCIDMLKKNFEEDFIKKLKDMSLYPNCLVNNARSLSNLKVGHEGIVQDDSIMNEYKLGVVAPYKLTMSLIRNEKSLLKKIVNISSIYGVVAPNLNLYNNPVFDSPIHYGLAKSALIHLTKELAVRLAKKNINVNCIAYGGLEGRANKSFNDKYSKLCPAGKMLSENELFKPLDLLLSSGSEGINGHVLMVDGGWTIW